MKSRTFKSQIRTGLWVGLAVGLVTLSGPAFGHSGGTDQYGCHAGSQPYHCHGGSGPPSGGGDGGGAPDPAPFYDSGPTAAERSALSEAQSEVANAKAEYSKSRSEAAALQQKLDETEKLLKPQRDRLSRLQRTLDRSREEAGNLREDRIAQQRAAAKRVALIEAKNEAAQSKYDADRLGPLFYAALFAGFLLLRWVRRLAGLIVGYRWAWIVGGLVGAMLWFNIGGSLESFVIGGLFAIVGGLMLSVTILLAGLWWLPFAVPKVLSVALLVLSGVLAVGSAGAMTETPPPTETEPAPADIALVQESKRDPGADDLNAAKEIDQNAAKLQAQVAKLESAMDEAEVSAESLENEVKAAKRKAAEDKQDVAQAESTLESLQ